MSRTVTRNFIKFIFTLIAAWIAYGVIDDNSITWILLVSIIVSIINYSIGDLIIFKSYGNVIASIIDGIFAAFIAYIMSFIITEFYVSWRGSLTFLGIIILCEYIIHNLILNKE